jgi:hypothetical protein
MPIHGRPSLSARAGPDGIPEGVAVSSERLCVHGPAQAARDDPACRSTRVAGLDERPGRPSRVRGAAAARDDLPERSSGAGRSDHRYVPARACGEEDQVPNPVLCQRHRQRHATGPNPAIRAHRTSR